MIKFKQNITRYIILICILTSISFCVSGQRKKKDAINKNIKPKKEQVSIGYLTRRRIDYYDTWSSQTAKVVPYKETHISAITRSRYGNFPKTEINSSLLLSALAPNIGFKHQWIGERTILSSQHTFFYPTVGLRLMLNTGFKDLVPKNSHIPQLFAFRNEIILSHVINKNTRKCFFKTPPMILTGRLGVDFAIVDGEYVVPPLDFFNFYHRSSIFIENRKLYFLGVALDGNLYRAFNFSLMATLYSIDASSEIAIENKAMIHWNKNNRFAFSFGIHTSYGMYNHENNFGFVPQIDFVYKLNQSVRLGKGLF